MRRVFIKQCLFFLPVAAITLILAGLAWHSGEALPVSRIVDLQQEAGGIYGATSESRYADYKLAAYHRRQPEILILGNSLTLNIRSEFLNKKPGAVYNASVGGWYLPDMGDFYQRLEHRPRIVITLIDLDWFSAEISGSAEDNPFGAETDFNYHRIRQAAVEMVHRLLAGQLSVPQILQRRDPLTGQLSLGLRALEYSHGYRFDGSRQLGRLAIRPQHWTRLQNEDRERELNQAERLSADPYIHEPAMAMLKLYLQEIHADGVTLIGVTTPRHFLILERMKELGVDRHIAPLRLRVHDLLAAFGFHYHYFGDMRVYGADSNEWYDGQHMSESNSLRLILALLESHPTVFGRYVDAEQARALLENFTNPMDVLHELPPL